MFWQPQAALIVQLQQRVYYILICSLPAFSSHAYKRVDVSRLIIGNLRYNPNLTLETCQTIFDTLRAGGSRLQINNFSFVI